MIKRLMIGLLVFVCTGTFAQNYTNAIGVRLGFGSGLTYKAFLSNSSAIEGIAAYQFDSKGVSLTGLYEFHNYRAFKTAHLALVYGAGAHVGYYDGGYYKNRGGIYYIDKDVETAFNFGVDGIFGIDYFITGSSINWGMDVKPMFDFINPGFRFWDAAISIRYVLK